jgi:hypothetical protein
MNHLHQCFSFLLKILLPFFLTGCVSVKINPNQAKKSENIVFLEPKSPFKLLSDKHEKMDRAWQSQKTGNTIGFISECGTTAVPLSQLENDVLSNLDNTNSLSNNKISFNDREAIETTIKGQVDGVKIKLALLVFRKSECSYTITYVGKEQNFDAESKLYSDFLNGFKVP